MKTLSQPLLAGLTALLLGGCAGLGPGDRVEIEIAGDPASRIATLIGPDGKIYYQVLPGIDVWGLTLAQAREALEHALTDLYREVPRVTLTLREVSSKQV